jgi:peptidyl-tRNA hydrolase, PTH2 family
MAEGPVKQVIVIRRDLKMRRGKEIAQGAHASMAFLTKRLGRWVAEGYGEPPDCLAMGRFTRAEYRWITGNFRKVVCQVADEEELLELYAAADAAGLECHLIQDAGLTEFGGELTYTALAIGPDDDDRIDPVTGNLRLY